MNQPNPYAGREQLFPFGCAGDDHLRRVHLLQVAGRDHRTILPLALIEMHLQPGDQVGHAGIDRPGRANRIDDAEGHALHLVLLLLVGQGKVIRLLRGGDGEVAARHAQRREDALAGKVLPGQAGEMLDQHAGGHEHQVVVLEGLADILVGLQVAQASKDLLAGKRRVVPQQVVAGQAHAVGYHVARGQTLAGHRVVQLEGRQEIADGLIPIQLALVHQQAQVEGGKGFGRRANGKERVGRDGKRAFPVAQAKAFAQQGLFSPDHANGKAGHLPQSKRLLDKVTQGLV